MDNISLTKTVLLTHLLILIGVSIIVFSNNKLGLFQGLDGAYFQILLNQMHEWMPFQFFLPYNPLQGNGNIMFMWNLPLLPSPLISYLFTCSANPVVIYTVVAVELFLSTVFLGYCFKLKPPVVILAAWLLPLISMPSSRFSIIYGLNTLSPYFIEAASLNALMIGGFYRLGKQSVFHPAFYGGLVMGTFFYTAVALPTMMILNCSTLLIFGLISLLTSSKSERQTKIVFTIVSLVICLPGLLPFMAGIFLDTAPAFFSSEMYNDRGNLHYVSLFFHSGDYGPYLVSFSLVGSVLASLVTKRHTKILARATLLCTLLILLHGSFFQRFWENYRGPSILYFEFFLWQFYCIFAAFTVVFFLGIIKSLIIKMTGRYSQLIPTSLPRLYLSVLILPVVIVRTSYFYPASQGSQWQTQKTAIVQKLEQEIAIFPGSEYRGRVATFTGYNTVPSVIWLNQHGYDSQLMRQIGNEHRVVGLWKYNIPTLIEYSQLITPSFYLMASRLLARPTDQQMRSIMVYSTRC